MTMLLSYVQTSEFTYVVALPDLQPLVTFMFSCAQASDFTFVYIKSTQPLSTAADR
jgi:hypothetical protein